MNIASAILLFVAAVVFVVVGFVAGVLYVVIDDFTRDGPTYPAPSGPPAPPPAEDPVIWHASV